MLKKSMAVALAVCSMGFASQVSATQLLAQDSDPRYLGMIIDGIPPSDFLQFVNNLLSLPANSPTQVIGTETYDRSPNNCPGPGGPACAAATDGTKTDGASSAINVTGYEYLWGKYDAANAGAYVWYVGGLTLAEIPQNLGNCGQGSGCGLSNYAVINWDEGGTPPQQIPEPASLALVGLSLAGLALTRRRRQQ